MEDDYASVEQPKLSKYNSALSQLYRLDALWQDSHRHARNLEYVKLNEDLNRVWLELSSDANKEDEKTWKEINKKISEVGIYSSFHHVRKIKPSLFAKIKSIQLALLMEKEEFLRRLQNKQGKGSAYEDSIEDYMDDGW